MITSWEALGDELADIHNELSYLHNSIGAGEIKQAPIIREKADPRLLTRVNELESLVRHLEKHVNSLVDKKNKSQFD